MSDDELIELVQHYFAGVDGEDIDRILGTLSEDCRFTVETHGVELNGPNEIRAMFSRLWGQHHAVRHENFQFICQAEAGRVSVQFQVVNTLPTGALVHKSNCNFFTVADGRFSHVAVYMAGENTLDRPGRP